MLAFVALFVACVAAMAVAVARQATRERDWLIVVYFVFVAVWAGALAVSMANQVLRGGAP